MNLLSGFGGKKEYEKDRAIAQETRETDKLDAVYQEELNRERREKRTRRGLKSREESISNEKYDVTEGTTGPRTTSVYAPTPLQPSSPGDVDSIFKPREKRTQRVKDAQFDYDVKSRLEKQRFESEVKRKEKERDIDYARAKDVEKARLRSNEKFRLEKSRAKLKQEAEMSRKYGPAINTPVIGGALTGISRYRNYKQEQDYNALKQRGNREGQQLRLERLQQARGADPRQQSMGGFGQSLSMGGQGMGQQMGLGQGMSLGPGPQQREDSHERSDPMSMGLPTMGWGQQRREEPAPEQRRVIQRAPQNETYAPGTGYEQEPGAIYVREMESYGPKYTRVSPEEVLEGEKLFKKVRTSYGYKYIKIRRR